MKKNDSLRGICSHPRFSSDHYNSSSSRIKAQTVNSSTTQNSAIVITPIIIYKMKRI